MIRCPKNALVANMRPEDQLWGVVMSSSQTRDFVPVVESGEADGSRAWALAHPALTRLARTRAAMDAEALEDLPAIGAALERGEPSWSAVRELT